MDAVEHARGNPRLRGGEELPLLEADVLLEERSERGEASGLSALGGREVLPHRRVITPRPPGEIGLARSLERREHELLLRAEVRLELGVEALPDLGRVDSLLVDAAREDEPLMVVGREALQARIPLHGA